MIKVKYDDNTEASLPEGTTVLEALKAHAGGMGKEVVAALVNNTPTDLFSVLPGDAEEVRVEPVTLDSELGLEIYRHSTTHVLAQAVKSLFKDAKLGIGPAIADGFYYDFDVEHPFTPQDLKRIEKRMQKIVQQNIPFERVDMDKAGAAATFAKLGEVYKEELINELDDEDGAVVSLYTLSDFTDMCRGPHLSSTGRIKAFKLTSIAGAYWRGDEKNKMLQRIYGTAFATKESLKEHLERIEEAKKRDHRKLGRELDLFSINEDTGPGLVLWHPKGSAVRGIIEDFWKTEHQKGGYGIIHTPHIALTEIWKTSGHWDFYKENLFSPMDVEGRDYIVKPMNCPFHIQVYKSRLRSYRDLPIRYAELGTVYRFERSGVLHGLLRVRGFTQDDAHIFTIPDKLGEEIKGVLNFTLYILKSFGFNEFEVYLSTRPEKYVGSLDEWQAAEEALRNALDSSGLPYTVDPGEGVFYGPKIDIKIRDVLGRAWQCSTIQVDFNLPERFDITFRDETSGESRPVMIHRALMGSLERFFGCLIEHYAGAFPVWLAPIQVAVLTVTERNDAYAAAVARRLQQEGFRVECDSRNEKLGFKIREAGMQKVPYMLIVGDRDQEQNLVSPRQRGTGAMEAVTVDEFIKLLSSENKPLGGGNL